MAFSSEVRSGSREENASKQKITASVLIQSEPKRHYRPSRGSERPPGDGTPTRPRVEPTPRSCPVGAIGGSEVSRATSLIPGSEPLFVKSVLQLPPTMGWPLGQRRVSAAPFADFAAVVAAGRPARLVKFVRGGRGAHRLELLEQIAAK